MTNLKTNFIKLNKTLPSDPVILPVISETNENLHFLNPDLLTITMCLKQPSYLSVGEWINMLCYRHTMEYFSALKQEGTQMNLRYIRLRKRNQTKTMVVSPWFKC